MPAPSDPGDSMLLEYATLVGVAFDHAGGSTLVGIATEEVGVLEPRVTRGE
jgi:hypothetical protein